VEQLRDIGEVKRSHRNDSFSTCQLDYSKTLKLRSRLGDLDLPEKLQCIQEEEDDAHSALEAEQQRELTC